MADLFNRSISGLRFARVRSVAALMLLVLALPGRAQTQPPLLHDAWGVRLGVLAIPEYPGAHPLFQPYYETATSDSGALTMIADLTIAFTSFSMIQFPAYDYDQLVDYGFHAGVRYALKPAGAITPFCGSAFGFDVYPDPVWPDTIGHVSASFPITVGVCYEASHSAQFEFAFIARPQWYFRQGWTFVYAVSIGGRFLSFSE
jgi:hypothetical protein